MTSADQGHEHATIVMPSAHAGPPRVGGRIGRYRLCLQLASGGMSTIYLARVSGAVGRNRFVAVKCLKPALAADASFVEMFIDEARLASLIDHPNVCSVIDYQAQGAVSYLVMELLQGKSLAAVRRALVTRAEPFPPGHYAGVVARVIADAAEGLHASHELVDDKGTSLEVVHRDVSPENVFLTYDGTVKIVDFGVAVTAQQNHHTQPGTLKGKYCYLQPEVLRGAKPDRRADVWGLGVIAWELLTQRRLFEVEHDVDALRAVLDQEIPRPSAVRPGLPPALDDIVMRALERDPARRWQTARELGRKLTWFIAEERMAIGLAELADFMGQLFPSGRACLRQQLDTVERMHDATLSADRDEHPTLAGPVPQLDTSVVRSIVDELSGRMPAATVAFRKSTSMAAVAPTPTTTATETTGTASLPRSQPRWHHIATPAIAVVALLCGGFFYLKRDPAVPAPPAAAATPPVTEPAEAPVCAPRTVPVDVVDDTLPADRDLRLAPVRLDTGEVVYRVTPAPGPGPGMTAATGVPTVARKLPPPRPALPAKKGGAGIYRW
jgi:serine/threonine protein kinase